MNSIFLKLICLVVVMASESGVAIERTDSFGNPTLACIKTTFYLDYLVEYNDKQFILVTKTGISRISEDEAKRQNCYTNQFINLFKKNSPPRDNIIGYLDPVTGNKMVYFAAKYENNLSPLPHLDWKETGVDFDIKNYCKWPTAKPFSDADQAMLNAEIKDRIVRILYHFQMTKAELKNFYLDESEQASFKRIVDSTIEDLKKCAGTTDPDIKAMIEKSIQKVLATKLDDDVKKQRKGISR